MSSSPSRWVVDASLVIKLFITEPYSSETRDLFESLNLNSPDDIYVPDLFYIECANVFWKHVRRRDFTAAEAEKEMAALKQLRLRPVSGWELMEQALEIAVRWDISVYDATYLALAERLEASLVTADEKLVKRVKAKNFRMVWIGDFKG
jgi:predicted nucleic acid-binding protein